MNTNQTASTGSTSLPHEIALYQRGWNDEMSGRPAPANVLQQYLAGRADARRGHTSK